MTGQDKNETKTFTSSMDARLWAKAFLKAYEALPAEEGLSEDFVWGWFANALMRGYDAGEAKQRLDKGPLLSAEHVLSHIGAIEGASDEVATHGWYVPGLWQHAGC